MPCAGGQSDYGQKGNEKRMQGKRYHERATGGRWEEAGSFYAYSASVVYMEFSAADQQVLLLGGMPGC